MIFLKRPKRLPRDIFNLRDIKKHKFKAILYIILRTILIGSFVFALVRGNWENAGMAFLTFTLLMIPTFIERQLKIELPTPMEVIVISFVFAAMFLGEMNSFYNTIPFWDSALHTVNGFICAGVGFGLIDILNRNDRVSMNLSPMFVVLFSFCFSMTTGVIWEFFEYGMDVFFGIDMQKDAILHSIHSYKFGTNGEIGYINDIKEVIINGKKVSDGYVELGLLDTMKDLLLNFVGAVVYNTAGFFYLKTRKQKADFIENFIPQRKTEV